MSAAQPVRTQHAQPQEQRPHLHLHQPSEQQVDTSQDLAIGAMMAMCVLFTVALVGFVVAPYISLWFAL